jgi:hypothetical protein
MAPLTHIALLFLSLGCSLCGALIDRTSLSLQVDPLTEECFFAEADEGQKVEATVLVFRGGKLDVYLRVEPPNGGAPLFNKLLFSNLADDGKMLPTIVKKGFSFTATAAGLYQVCVDNKMAKYTAKVLTLDVTVSDVLGGGRTGDVVKAPAAGSELLADELEHQLTTTDGLAPSAIQHVARVKQLAARLQSVEDRFLDDLRYHSLRTRRHHDTLVSTEARVGWWACAELAAVALAAAFQVLLVFTWFSGTAGAAAVAAAGGGGAHAPPPLFSALPLGGGAGLSARKAAEGSTSARGRA